MKTAALRLFATASASTTKKRVIRKPKESSEQTSPPTTAAPQKRVRKPKVASEQIPEATKQIAQKPAEKEEKKITKKPRAPRTPRSKEDSPTTRAARTDDGKASLYFGIQEAIKFMTPLKLLDIKVYEVAQYSIFTDFWIVATAQSTRQIRAVAESLRKTVRENNLKHSIQQPVRSEYDIEDSNWIVVDLGDVWIHLMTKEGREQHELEKGWEDCLIKPENWTKLVDYRVSKKTIVVKDRQVVTSYQEDPECPNYDENARRIP